MSNDNKPTLPPEHAKDLRFEIFVQLSACNSILAAGHNHAVLLDDPAILNALDFLRKHVGGALYSISKQIFEPQHTNDEQKHLHSDSTEKTQS